MNAKAIRIGLAAFLAVAAGGGAVFAPPALAARVEAATAEAGPGPRAGRERAWRLAARDDPSMPVFTPPPKRRAAPERKPTVPPFALPTAPITVTPEAQERPPAAGPGGSEFPPYEEELLRLTEILGAMHYLSDLCQAGDGAVWRDKMEQVIAAEAPQPAWRGRLVDGFNRGYRGFERTYRQCTPSAARAIELYLSEGESLTGLIKERYAD